MGAALDTHIAGVVSLEELRQLPSFGAQGKRLLSCAFSLGQWLLWGGFRVATVYYSIQFNEFVKKGLGLALAEEGFSRRLLQDFLLVILEYEVRSVNNGHVTILQMQRQRQGPGRIIVLALSLRIFDSFLLLRDNNGVSDGGREFYFLSAWIYSERI